jgi:putative mRNA 3-end processing factor
VDSLVTALLTPDWSGLYCPAGEFHIDPHRSVPLAVITHAHSDHVRPGSGIYIMTVQTAAILANRFTPRGLILLEYGEVMRLGSIRLSLHPSGHMLGSAQVRLEHDDGRVWVVTGDIKLEADASCDARERLRCDGLVIESTFGLPIFSWPEPSEIESELLDWWDHFGTVLIEAYSFGKTQRIISMVLKHRPELAERIAVDPAMIGPVETYQSFGLLAQGIRQIPKAHEPGLLMLTPPGSQNRQWFDRLPHGATGTASGWMLLPRRAEGVGKPLVISDHACWAGLLQIVRESGASTVWTTHGYDLVLARYLKECLGLDAKALRFGGSHEEV